MGFKRHPTYVRKARNGYQLQRGVPKDLQRLLGKKVWVEPGGATYREAHRRSPAFVARTDRDIAVARGERDLSVEELTDSLPTLYDLQDQEMVELLDAGADEALAQGWMNREQAGRYLRVLHGEEAPKEHLTAEELVELATSLKSPAQRTRNAWKQALNGFLAFSGVLHPTAATRQQAIDYRGHLLEHRMPSSAKTELAYLSGLWSILHELRPEIEHIFEGLNKRIKIVRQQKEELLVIGPEEWHGSQDHIDILSILYFTGARLAEVAGLRGEDILDDRIIIRPNGLRPLKTSASDREVPLHPRLLETARRLQSRTGYLWPSQYQAKHHRWGVNLSKPSKQIAGVSPKGLRDRAVTVLRAAGLNEAVAARLLGHTPSWMTAQYGGVPWEKLVEAVALL